MTELSPAVRRAIVARYEAGESYIDLRRAYFLNSHDMSAILRAAGLRSLRKRPWAASTAANGAPLASDPPVSVPEDDPLARVDHRRYEWQRADADHLDSVLTAHLVSLGVQRRGVPVRDAALVRFGERYD